MKILIICFLLLFGTIIQVANAHEECIPGTSMVECPFSSDVDRNQLPITLESKFEINELGRLLIEYRITLTNNNTVAPAIKFNQPISFFLPKEYENKISAYEASSESLEELNIKHVNELVIISQNKRNTVVTIDFRNENFEIIKGSDIGITLKLILVDVVELTEKEGLYKVLIPEITTTNFHLDRLNFIMYVPETATYANIEPMWDQKFEYFFLTETEDSNAFSKVIVDEIVREIFIAKNGKIMIKETIKITNKGFYDLKYIPVNLIGPEVDENGVPLAKTITTVPNREPALNSKKLVILLNPPANRLSITEILRIGIPEEQSAILTFVYPLPEKYISHNINSITVTIPTESPLPTISEKYSIVINSCLLYTSDAADE